MKNVPAVREVGRGHPDHDGPTIHAGQPIRWAADKIDTTATLEAFNPWKRVNIVNQTSVDSQLALRA